MPLKSRWKWGAHPLGLITDGFKVLINFANLNRMSPSISSRSFTSTSEWVILLASGTHAGCWSTPSAATQRALKKLLFHLAIARVLLHFPRLLLYLSRQVGSRIRFLSGSGPLECCSFSRWLQSVASTRSQLLGTSARIGGRIAGTMGGVHCEGTARSSFPIPVIAQDHCRYIFGTALLESLRWDCWCSLACRWFSFPTFSWADISVRTLGRCESDFGRNGLIPVRGESSDKSFPHLWDHHGEFAVVTLSTSWISCLSSSHLLRWEACHLATS